MKIGIICAGDDELKPFLGHLEQAVVTEKAMLQVHEGQINGMDTAMLYSGVCKVNAAIAAQVLIDCYHVDALVNAGTAGGMAPHIGLFDTVIATQTAYHDVAEDILTDFHPWLSSIYLETDKALLKAAKMAVKSMGLENSVFFGKIVTGETFISEGDRASINKVFSPLAVDMESAAIAHVCYVNQLPFLSIRTVTDTAQHSGVDHFEKNCEKASCISKDIVLKLLEQLTQDVISEAAL